GLRHQLNAAQMTMVAVGGSIGTGLLLGTAAAIELAGPAVIPTFVLAAFICWTVALALGELASTHPAAGSFGVYGDLYLNAWARSSPARPHLRDLHLRRSRIRRRDLRRVELGHGSLPCGLHDVSGADLPLPWRRHHSGGRHALESRRSHRESVCHRLPLGGPA